MGHEKRLEILLVDDNAGDIRMIVEGLKDTLPGSTLSVARDGEEAIQFLRREGVHRHAPRPDFNPARFAPAEKIRLRGVAGYQKRSAAGKNSGSRAIVLGCPRGYRARLQPPRQRVFDQIRVGRGPCAKHEDHGGFLGGGGETSGRRTSWRAGSLRSWRSRKLPTT